MDKKSKDLKITISDGLKVRDNLELKTFWGETKKFIVHVIGGWFPSKRADLSPDGVQKERVIDRANNRYKEKVTDAKTGRIIRDLSEKLTDHRK